MWNYAPPGNAASPASIDIVIVGAGPQALTLVTHLLQKKKSMRQRLVVVDPAGQWLHQWNHQFAAFEISHLRSPAAHHPDPNLLALRSFAIGRPNELFSPHDLPGTKLFREFCQDVIRRWRLQDCIVASTVNHLEPYESKGKQRIKLHLTGGRYIVTKRVVLATAESTINLPQWTQEISCFFPANRLLHSSQIDLRGVHLAAERILIVGSGLTSGHLALAAVSRGAQVILMARRCFYEKLFDADPGWLGPKFLKGFLAEPDWQMRWQMIHTARNGGSLTPAILSQLRRLELSGQLCFYEDCQVHSVQWKENAWSVNCNRADVHECIAHLPIHRIWLATGTRLDVNQWRLLKDLRAAHPLSLIHGLPTLDSYLRWPGCNVFIMGGAAALQLGPSARNLYGAKLACQRIVPTLIKHSVA